MCSSNAILWPLFCSSFFSILTLLRTVPWFWWMNLSLSLSLSLSFSFISSTQKVLSVCLLRMKSKIYSHIQCAAHWHMFCPCYAAVLDCLQFSSVFSVQFRILQLRFAWCALKNFFFFFFFFLSFIFLVVEAIITTTTTTSSSSKKGESGNHSVITTING